MPEPTPPARKRGRGADPAETKQALVDAAFDTLLHDGFANTTARSIAARAACNQAAIYYHFGGIEALLLESLKASNSRRLARYQAELADRFELPALVAKLAELYEQDRASGHLGVLTELAGGIAASPSLQAGIKEATEPWLSFVEHQVARAAQDVPFGAMIPAADIADLVFSLVIGLEMRNKIDGRTDRADRLFKLAGLAASLIPTT
jgi:AcrR family transcriptional regulator